MQREMVGDVRPNHEVLLHNKGLVYNDSVTEDGVKVQYWREGPYYVFTKDECNQLGQDIATMHEMCVEAGDWMLERPEFLRRMGISDEEAWIIRRAWERDELNVYGRFDLRYDGNGPPKLLEYNADTPTSLLEAAELQWDWFLDTRKANRLDSQYNEIWEKLVETWNRKLALWELQTGRNAKLVHLIYDASERSGEDLMNTAYMMQSILEAASQTTAKGDEVECVLMPSTLLRYNHEADEFRDDKERRVDIVFKLYPWEWLSTREVFTPFILGNMRRAYQAMSTDPHGPFTGKEWFDSGAPYRGTTWVEPIYKRLLSNKALTVALWARYKDDPDKSKYLLPAYWADDDHGLTDYVRKPLLGREGANVTIIRQGDVIESTSGQYGDEGYIVQQLAPLPSFPTVEGKDVHPVIGAWVIGGYAAGISIRESYELVTGNTSYFVPSGIRD